MGTISNTLSGYYQLSTLLSSASGSSLTSTNSTSGSSPESLAQILDSSGSSGSGSGSAFLLDLSPQAQQLLSGSSASSSAGGQSTDFTLTQTQITAIKNIIEKYKDAPLTQATFDEIQTALQAAGLSPQTLGALDQVNSFNPTNVLLSALNGNYASLQTPAASASSEQAKESNYMKDIVSFWKSIDPGTSSASGSSASGTASSGSGTGL